MRKKTSVLVDDSFPELRMEEGITQNTDEKQKVPPAPPSSTMDHDGIIRNQEQASVWRMVRKCTVAVGGV